MRRRALAVTFFAFVWLMLAFSAATAYGQTMTTTKKAPTAPKSFGLLAFVSKSKSLYDYQDGSRLESTEVALYPSYQIKRFKTTALITYIHNDRFAERSDIEDIPVVTSYQGWKFQKFNLSPSMTVLIPQSKISREYANLETGISTRLNATIHRELLVPGFYFVTGAGVTRYFHRYETALTGPVNNQYGSIFNISTGYEYGIYSFNVELNHMNSWTYAGGRREYFNHSEEVSVALSKDFSVSLGHTNEGSVLKPNGYDSNVSLIDDNSSLVFAKLSFQY